MTFSRTLALFETVGQFTIFSWRVLRELPACFLSPRSTLAAAAGYVAGSLGLCVIVGLCIGLVTWMHLSDILSRYDSKTFLPSSLMVAVVLEVGPLAVGMIAASRLASGIAAELSAMQASEQIDALVCLGVSPYRRLLAPRILALMLVLPPLTLVVDYAALAGSYLAEWLGGELSWQLYYRQAIEQLRLAPSLLSTGKTVVFGLLVGLVACWQGITADRGAEAIGQAATQAVVVAMLAVLVSDVFAVRVIQILLG